MSDACLLAWLGWGFGLQGFLMLVDEFYYHRQRGLGTWESWGHPIDSLCFILPQVYALSVDFSVTALWWYSFLVLFSCAVIIKDEWVHAREASAGEHALHAGLFVLHGPLLIGVGLAWARDIFWVFRSLLVLGFCGAFLYQLYYWRFRKSVYYKQ